MKNFITIIFTAILFTSCSQQKIGYVNVEDLMKDYQATKDLEASLKLSQEKIAKELDSLGKAFQSKVVAFEKAARRMSGSKRKAKENELVQEQQVLQAKQQTATQSLQKEQQESSNKLTEDIEAFVADYSKKNNFKMVFGTSGSGTVLYGEDSLDLTKIILNGLNTKYITK